MTDTLIKHAIKTAGTMLAFALVGTALLAYVFEVTRTPIENSEAEARIALFKQILPDEAYYNDDDDEAHDNHLLKNIIEIAPNPLLGNKTPTKAYRAKRHHKFEAVILEAIAHDGYSGDIKLLIAIRADGSISGVRVLAHKETPGLGDYIDITHSNWINQFNDESLAKTPAQQWQVKKDGGQFDYMAGATITPRAVVKAIFKATQYFEENKQVLFFDEGADKNEIKQKAKEKKKHKD
ncbi:MAG: electron transport complex subunit RsxG [Methylotenera sp.]|nr:electron transport complex subunit RsxG [Methylotenera sp.]